MEEILELTEYQLNVLKRSFTKEDGHHENFRNILSINDNIKIFLGDTVACTEDTGIKFEIGKVYRDADRNLIYIPINFLHTDSSLAFCMTVY